MGPWPPAPHACAHPVLSSAALPPLPWQVTAYYAPQFAELRRRVVAGGEAAFLASISRCRKWASRGGKSSVYFARTHDKRWVRQRMAGLLMDEDAGGSACCAGYACCAGRHRRAAPLRSTLLSQPPPLSCAALAPTLALGTLLPHPRPTLPARSYIIKQLSRSERQSFLEFAPDYFRYVATMLHRGQETCLAKILGVYQVLTPCCSRSAAA